MEYQDIEVLFVPHPHAPKDPGLLFITNDGFVMYYPHISHIISSLDQKHETQIPLQPSVLVNETKVFDDSLIVVGTNTGQLFALLISDHLGLGLQVIEISKGRGLLSSFSKYFRLPGANSDGRGDSIKKILNVSHNNSRLLIIYFDG